jgi:hypothetical protein
VSKRKSPGVAVQTPILPALQTFRMYITMTVVAVQMCGERLYPSVFIDADPEGIWLTHAAFSGDKAEVRLSAVMSRALHSSIVRRSHAITHLE